MKYIKYVIETIGAILGVVLAYFFIKDKEDEQILKDNDKVVAGLAKEDTTIKSNDGIIAQEQVTQNQLQADIKKVQNEDTSKETPDNVVSFFTIANNCFAQTATSPTATFLTKGATAPYDGVLLTPDKAVLVKQELIELDDLRKLAISYQKSLDAYKTNEDAENTKVNILLDQNLKLATTLQNKESRDKWQDWLCFAGGILVTSLSIYFAERLK